MAKKKSTAVMAVPTQEVAQVKLESAWGAEEVGSQDIKIPKLLLMQGLSKKVMAGEAGVGEVRDSLTNEWVGGKKGKENVSFDVIPFSMFKTWIIFKKVNGKDEYQETIPMDHTNANWPMEQVVNGEQIRRDYCINFYVLRPEDIASGLPFPYVLSLRRYGLDAAKRMATMGAKLKQVNRPMASKTITLGVSTKENNKGTFFVYDMVGTKDTPASAVEACFKWYETVKQANVKIDESDLTEEVNSEQKETLNEF